MDVPIRVPLTTLFYAYISKPSSPPSSKRERVQSNKRQTTQSYSLWGFRATAIYCITGARSYDKTSIFMLDVFSNRRVYWHYSLGKVEFSMSLCTGDMSCVQESTQDSYPTNIAKVSISDLEIITYLQYSSNTVV